MNYFKIRNRKKQFESVTDLKLEEFEKLLSIFEDKWRNFYRIHTIDGKKRKGPISNPLKDKQNVLSRGQRFIQ